MSIKGLCCLFGHDWRGPNVEIKGAFMEIFAKTCARCGKQEWFTVVKHARIAKDTIDKNVYHFEDKVLVRMTFAKGKKNDR